MMARPKKPLSRRTVTCETPAFRHRATRIRSHSVAPFAAEAEPGCQRIPIRSQVSATPPPPARAGGRFPGGWVQPAPESVPVVSAKYPQLIEPNGQRPNLPDTDAECALVRRSGQLGTGSSSATSGEHLHVHVKRKQNLTWLTGRQGARVTDGAAGTGRPIFFGNMTSWRQ